MKKQQKEHKNLYIIGIGASAGGLEAYNEFFDNASENPSFSYILVQHLSPDYKSLLVDLLSKHTTMRVFEAENDMPIEPNCIYVIPPKKHLTVEPGKLVLTDKDDGDRGPNTAIDNFFYSLGEVYKENAIAVVLSGTGTDGSRGIQAIKDNDGLVIVQEPMLSKFDGMPRSSIGTGLADLVLPTKAMYVEIERYISDVPKFEKLKKEVSEKTLTSILKVLDRHTGCNFVGYKTSSVLRRLIKRVAFLNLHDEQEYLAYLTGNPEEGKLFARDLLIGVTRFFRDPEAFKQLREKVLKPLVESKQDHDSIKIWVTACSTGEEVYTIAMILNDLLRTMDRRIDVKIFGTDLEPTHIERASKGEYPTIIGKEVPPEFLKCYFIQRDNYFVVSPEIRKQVVFARHNVITDPPFIKNDLISCRNMLIYLDTKLQKEVLSKFRFGLNDHGCLFLGSSESIAVHDNFLLEVDRKWKLYTKIGTAPHKYPSRQEDEAALPRITRQPGQPEKVQKPQPQSLADSVNATVFEDFDIAGFSIDKNYIIQETSGNYKKYVSLPDDGIRLNLLKMLPDSVSIPLNSAIIQCSKEDRPVQLRGLQYIYNGQSIHLSISVRPDKLMRGLLLVVFNSVWQYEESERIDEAELPETGTLSKLKKDLQETRFNLQTTIEELETTNEELQSSNEELLSSNEELQSSNEELQSLNEELHTLNAEHQLKIQELQELTDDLNNYFRCSDIGQVIIDRNLLIRRFNPAAARYINLVDNDVQRSISHFTRNFTYHNFESDISSVLKENRIVEEEVSFEDGRTILVRIHSYIRKDEAIDGALISFIDVTAYKKLNSIINGVFDSSKNAIIALAAVHNARKEVVQFETITGNAIASELFNRNFVHEHHLLSTVSSQLNKHLFDALVEVYRTGAPFSTEIGLQGKWFDVSAVQMQNGVALTLNDISMRKQVEDQLRKSYGDLIIAKENLKQLNQELEKRVMERTRDLGLSEERFRLISGVTNDVLIDWSLIDNSLWVSSNYSRLFAYPEAENGLDRRVWVERIHPDDRVRVIGTIMSNVNDAVVSWEQEYRYEDAHGDYHQVTDRSFLMKDDRGMPYRLLSSMLDITKLRQAEEELRNSEVQLDIALESAMMAGWSRDLQTDTLYYSPMLPTIFDLNEEEAADMYQFSKRLHPDDLKIARAALQKCLKGGSYSYEARIFRKDKSLRWIRVTGKLIRDENDQPVQLIGITRDITDDKHMALQLERMVEERTADLNVANEQLTVINKQLSRTNSELEQFAYIASHDLQEPLRKIQIFISLITDQDRDDTFVRNYLEKIKSSASRMSSLISNVLEYSRLSKSNRNFERIDLDQVFADILTDFELVIMERNAEIEVDPLPKIAGIPHQLNQLFQNLLGNALKFCDKQPEISVKTLELTPEMARRLDITGKPEDYVAIRIKDNGIGFDPSYSKDIFRFFYRLDAHSGVEGNGIGLALCKKIVDNHGGYIEASSTPGKGAEFLIVLPKNNEKRTGSEHRMNGTQEQHTSGK